MKVCMLFRTWNPLYGSYKGLPLLLMLLSQSKSRSVNNVKLYPLYPTCTLFENSLKPNMVQLETSLVDGATA